MKFDGGRNLVPLIVVTLVAISGCQTGVTNLMSELSDSLKPLRNTVRELNEFPSNEEFVHWSWAPAIPQNVQRAELVSAVIPGQEMRQLVADIPGHEIALVSGNAMNEEYRIVNVNGTKIDTCRELYRALDRLPLEPDKSVQVDIVASGDGITSTRETAVIVDQSTLKAMVGRVSADDQQIKVTDGDNAWLVHRSPGLQLKMTARIERHRGLMQMVMSMYNTSKQAVLMPEEIRASCNGQPLKCLTVSDTLEVLYGQREQPRQELSNEQTSFAKVSERDDFLLPVNYQRLETELQELFKHKAQSPPCPALLSTPGETYPGSAVLGDARALTSFMMQRKLCKSGEPESIGWILFASEQLKEASQVEVEVQLPHGNERFVFTIPAGQDGAAISR